MAAIDMAFLLKKNAEGRPCGRSIPRLRTCPSFGGGSGWSRLTKPRTRGTFIQTIRKTIPGPLAEPLSKRPIRGIK
jgi:hypothetical protein